jgi:uncharacterized membrane protein (DUF106 family)
VFNQLLKQSKGFKKAFAKQLLKLVTSAFGLVAALAWNEVIKEAVAVYVRPVAGESSGLISLLIYAFIVTILAVFVTYYLTKAVRKDTS